MMFNSPKAKIPRVIVAVLLIILALFILNYFRSGVKNFFYLISSPIQRFFWQIGDSVSEFFTKDSLRKEVINLRLQNQDLLNRTLSFDDLQKENDDLRGALQLNLQKDFKLVSAKIISKDIGEDSILIDEGSEDGISENMPVINQQKVLFGKVSEVYRNFSRVDLITHKSFVSDVKVQEKEIYGIAKGNGDSAIYLDLIPRDSDLKEGDVLLTSNLAGTFPQNLLIGEVKTTKKEATKPYQTAEIRAFFDLKNTDNLFLITNFKK